MLGLNSVHWYIYMHSSNFYCTTGHDGSVVSALASKAKGRGSITSYGTSFFSHKYFLSFLSNLRWESN